MGLHFDQLVEFTRHAMDRGEKPMTSGLITCPKQYLETVIRRSTLFELDFNVREIDGKLGKTDAEKFQQYGMEYLNTSQQNGTCLITPFSVTCIEDDISLVILQRRGDRDYIVTTAFHKQESYELTEGFSIGIAGVTFKDFGTLEDQIELPMTIKPLYVNDTSLEKHPKKVFDNISPESLMYDAFKTAVASYIKQILYIMDPTTFIVQRQNTKQRAKRLKSNGKKQRKKTHNNLHKTANRPVYTAMGKDEIKAHFHDVSKGKCDTHPVVAYTMRFAHERYTNMRMKTVQVPQLWKGEGVIDGQNGITYEVFMKMSATKLLPYARFRNQRVKAKRDGQGELAKKQEEIKKTGLAH